MTTRRELLKALAGYVGVTSIPYGYAWQVEPRWVEYVVRPLPIPQLPTQLAGKMLVQFSDLHIGTKLEDQFFEQHFRQVSSLNPDFVVYTGDFVSAEDVHRLNRFEKVIAAASKGSCGTFAVLGNHDYGHQWRDRAVASNVQAILANVGIKTLRDEVEMIAGLAIIGTEDYWSSQWNGHKVATILADLNGSAAVALCHNPVAVDEPIWRDYQGMILSGHTHGGQFRFPIFNNPAILVARNKAYVEGEIALGNGRFLYVNRGLGSSPIQFRFNSRPEITLWILTPAV